MVSSNEILSVIDARVPLSLKQQSFIWSSGLVVQFFAQWLIGVLLVRMGSYEIAGIFALSMSVSNIFAYFANFGLRNVQITARDDAVHDLHYLCSRLFTIVVSLFGCVVYLLISRGYTLTEKISILLYLGYNSVNTISDTMQGTVQTRGHLEMGGFSNAFRGMSCLAGFLSIYYVTESICAALASMVFASLMVLLLYDFRIFKRFFDGFTTMTRREIALSRHILWICFPLMLSQTIPILTTAIPRRMIQNLFGTDMLGVYSSIFAPMAIVLTVIPSLVTAVLPVIRDRWIHRGRIAMHRFVFAGVLGILVVSLFGEMCIWLVGRQVMTLLFGEDILSFFSLAFLAVPVTVLNGASGYFNGLLTVMRRIKVIPLICGVPLLVIAIASRHAVLRGGVYGAAEIQIVAYVLQVLIQVMAIWIFITKEDD